MRSGERRSNQGGQMQLRSIASLYLCLCFAVPLAAQDKNADPLSGVWFGDYGTNPRTRTQARLVLEWDGKVLVGTVSTGDEPIELKNTRFDPKTGMVHLEVTVPGRGNFDFNYIVDGKLDKDTISGTWHSESGKGDFQIKKLP